MRLTNRDGFTLIELLVAFTLLAVVMTAIQQTMVMSQRATGAQVQRMSVQQSVRAVGFYLSHVFRELDASESDVASIGADDLRIRSMRWAAVLCTAPAPAGSNVTFVVRGDLFFGLRGPDEALDSILLFRELDPSLSTDDRWLVGGLMDRGGGVCSDGSTGRTLAVNINAASGGNAAALVGVTDGSPVRGFQMEDLSLHEDADGSYWLAQRTADRAGSWTPIRPVVGPLMGDGLAFAYYDANGVVTNQPDEIASIGLVVRGRSTARVRVGNRSPAFLRDSVTTRIALRNNVRF